MLSYTCIARHVLITLLCATLKLHASYQTSYSLNVFESKHEVCFSLSYYTRPISFRCRASRETDRYNTHRKTDILQHEQRLFIKAMHYVHNLLLAIS